MFRCGRCGKVGRSGEKGVMQVMRTKPVVDPVTGRTGQGIAEERRTHASCERAAEREMTEREAMIAAGIIRPPMREERSHEGSTVPDTTRDRAAGSAGERSAGCAR